jgi:hypothetical protein
MTSIPTCPDAFLTRENLSRALKEAGFPVESTTLATKATRGGGPPFQKFGSRVLYQWGDALMWARSLLSTPRHSTSEADVIRQAAPAPSIVHTIAAETKTDKHRKSARSKSQQG